MYMKKVYVKAKTPSVKTMLKRPYIAATIIGVAICAITLSNLIDDASVDTQKDATLSTTMQTEEILQTAEKTSVPQKEIPSAPQTEVTAPDRQTPERTETDVPGTQEISASEQEAEGISVGLFKAPEKVQFIKPVEGEILNAYSGTKPVKSKTLGDWRLHTGIDIRAEKGSTVKAAADGVVCVAKKDSLTGYTISIDHGNGVISTVYNLENAETVQEGQEVKQGDPIGTVGNSATVELSEDSHAHFEVKIQGTFVDPTEYFK